MRQIPRNLDEWLVEIADAYADAFETLPFMPLVNVKPEESALFHLAPRVAVKFRGRSEKQVDAATEAALASYVASREQNGAALDTSYLSFAFCYLAALFGIGILSDDIVQEIMEFVENNPDTLRVLITEAIHK